MALFSVSYFPDILTTSLLLRNSITIEAFESFVKQTYRSRCRILGPNDILTLSVPVVGGRKNTPIRELPIDHSQRWQDRQWRSITAAYSNAPFFMYYEDRVKKVLFDPGDLLFDLSLRSMQATFDMLQSRFAYDLTSDFVRNWDGEGRDFRDILNEKKASAPSDIFTAIPYQQNFGKVFAPNLSTLDVIFCEGPNARSIVEKSTG